MKKLDRITMLALTAILFVGWLLHEQRITALETGKTVVHDTVRITVETVDLRPLLDTSAMHLHDLNSDLTFSDVDSLIPCSCKVLGCLIAYPAAVDSCEHDWFWTGWVQPVLPPNHQRYCVKCDISEWAPDSVWVKSENE